MRQGVETGSKSMTEGQKAKDFATKCLLKLRAAGHEAYFAGGCVRDMLLGKEPHDFDIASSALPHEVEKLFLRTVPVGAAFNVVLVLEENVEHPLKVEVATFRKDVGVGDGRHPAAVEKASAQEDVARRDFSINGMFFDPVSNEVLDWVGGQEDLRAKIIRAIGQPEQRMQEDYLRMLRAVRFAARLDYKIEDSLLQTIKKLAPQIHRISAERIFDELTKMLTEGRAHIAFESLADTGLLAEILPEALPMKGVPQPPEYHPEGDVWVHTMLLLKQLTPQHAPELAWGCLLHDIGKPPTFSHEPPDRIRFNRHAQVGAEMSLQILKRLKAPTRFQQIVEELVADHLKFADVKKMKPTTLKRFLRNPHFQLHLEQHRIDCLASHENLELYEFCKQSLSELKEEDLKPAPLLTGKDLIDLGMTPGPDFKRILESVETEQLEGRLTDRASAIAFVKSIPKGS